jgi:photosystem II stability/assembly factor-like uncharacterized protein
MRLASAAIFTALALHAQSWAPQNSGTSASLRGLSAVDSKTVWASGTRGTYVVTTDGGATWRAASLPGAEKLDFRAVRAFDAHTAYLLSIGTGEQSRVYKTTDSGATWKLLFKNPDAKGFFDGLAFWDARRGIIAGDAVDGRIAIFTTDDSGEHWTRRETPPAIGEEGAFAASNTSLALFGAHDVWLGTGGKGAARVLHSKDNGRTWAVAPTPIRNDSASAGIFSVCFQTPVRGIAVGGDYTKPGDSARNIALTTDGGQTWTALSGKPPADFRSAVAYIPDLQAWVATGTSGSDISTDGGANWKQFDAAAYNALAFVSGGAGWAVGPRGAIAKFIPPR